MAAILSGLDVLRVPRCESAHKVVHDLQCQLFAINRFEVYKILTCPTLFDHIFAKTSHNSRDNRVIKKSKSHLHVVYGPQKISFTV